MEGETNQEWRQSMTYQLCSLETQQELAQYGGVGQWVSVTTHYLMCQVYSPVVDNKHFVNLRNSLQ